MLRLFLIHLERFLRCYLVACFASLLIVPLGFNLCEIIRAVAYPSNLMYLLTALLPALVAAVYTWQQRRRINSDELVFYLRNRLRYQTRLLIPYFELTGVLLRQVAGFDLKLRQGAFLAALQLADAVEREAMTSQAAANAAAMGLGDFTFDEEGPNQERLEQLAVAAAQTEALSSIETMVLACRLTLKRKSLELSKAALLRGLKQEPTPDNLTQALAALKLQVAGMGPYFESWLVISLVRSVMNALPHEVHSDFNALCQNPILQQVADELLSSETAHRCVPSFLFLLNQEVYRLRHRAAYVRAQFAQAQQAARAHQHAGAAYADSPHADGAHEGGTYEDWNHSGGGRDGWTHAGSYEQHSKERAAKGTRSKSGTGARRNAGTGTGPGFSFRADFGEDFGEDFAYGSYYYEGYYDSSQRSDERYGAEHDNFEGSRYSYRDDYEERTAHEEPEELSELERAYQVLGVTEDATLSAIKARYRRLAFVYHPDHIKDYMSLSPAQQRVLNAKFQEICNAYATILAARARHDASA